MTNGCTRDYPSGVTSKRGDEKHAVRCCNDIGDTCTNPDPCEQRKTYQEAKAICSKQGLRLCERNEKLSSICCRTGCKFDYTTMWIADDPPPITTG